MKLFLDKQKEDLLKILPKELKDNYNNKGTTFYLLNVLFQAEIYDGDKFPSFYNRDLEQLKKHL